MKCPSTTQPTLREALRLACWALMASLLLSGNLALSEPVNLLKIPFTNAPPGNLMPSDTTLGGSNVNLTMYSAAGVASPYQGAAGSGVNGAATGARALCLTNGAFATQPGQPFEPANATGGGSGANAAAYALDSSDAALGFGNITNFIVTMWVNQFGKLGTTTPVGPRLFILNAGAPTSDTGQANSIGVKYQANNQLYFGINTAASLGATLASDLVSNKWQFFAWAYDGTNLYEYYGSDATSAQLVSTAASASQTVALGGSASLIIGNRTGSPAHTRGLNGWIQDFRFYNGVSTNNLSFVESIRKEIAPKVPTFTGIYPDGTALLQATNEFVFNATSSSGLNLTNISLVVNGVNVSSSCTYVTNGTAGTSTNVSVSYTGLPQQRTNSAVMTATDGLGLTGTATVAFDTYNPTNFIVKAEEFDFNSGQFIDNPVYTNVVDDPGVTNTYFGLDSVDGVDTRKGSAAGAVNDVNCYRATDGSGTRTQTPLAAGELPSPTRFGGSVVPGHMVGNWSSAEWQNYTKTFPAGVYNVYARVSSSSSSTITFDQVTAGQGTSSQTLNNLGTFTFSGTSLTAFEWVPLIRFGQLATVNLAGVSTVRATTGGGAAADFYMFVPANTNVPTISGVYPNGQALFQPTNKLVFTVSSAAANISTADIHLTLNGTNLDASLVFTGGPSTWNCSYTGLQLNQTYAVVIQVTDNNANSSSATFTIDTWNPVFQVEAEDFDFDGGQYIDNPVPTTSQAANSYFWRVGVMNVDESNNGGLPPYAGANPANYRANPNGADPIACTPVTDTKRQQFVTASAPDYNVGFMGPFFWQNYTKTWPAGTFNIYMRVAAGAASPAIQHEGFDQITSGWGTTVQGIKHIGGFNIPRTGGWSAYTYVPLLDQFGNYANVTLGGTNTFRATFARSLGVDYPTDAANGAVNINFYMLLAARTDLPRLDNVYPDGSAHFESDQPIEFHG